MSEGLVPVRRLRRILIDPVVLVALFKSTKWFHSSGLPDDAKPVGFYWDNEMGLHVMFVESEQYLPVPEGGEVPLENVQFTTGETWLEQ